jgi:trigger factor
MLKQIEELSPTRRKLIIDVPQDVIQSETDTAYNELIATAKIPGFRQGKVPRSILTKKFGKNVEAQIIEKIVPEFYLKAIKEAKIEPVSYPSIDDTIELKTGQPLSFSVTVEIKPVISEINYEGIALKEKTFTVEDSEIEKALKSLQESKALYSVSDEALKEEDMSIISTEAFIDDQPREEMTYKEFPFVIGSGEMPKEFSEALIGKKKGDTAEVKISFEPDNPNKTLAGKEVVFKVTVADTKKKNLPPLDDDFAKEAECSNMEELKNKIRDTLTERKKGQINLDYKKDILNELLKNHSFDAPESMIQGEIESLVERAKEEAMRKGEAAKPDEELKKESEATAHDNVKSVILLEAIGKKESITVNDEETKNAINEIAVRNNLKPEEVTKLYSVREGSMEALKSRLFADKVLDFILEKAEIDKT